MPVILVRSGWQTENIGDIAHTPGLLSLLQTLLPDAPVILWSNALDRGVGEMLHRNFPKLTVVGGGTGADGAPDNASLADAFHKADLLLHGSGPGVVARAHLDAWRMRTGKPYGIFGVTIPAVDPALKATLQGARFVFTRETASLENLKQAGLAGPQVQFVPDATFNLKLRDDEPAKAFLSKHGLETKKFICVVPRLRYTPYHQMREVDWSAEKIRERTAVNERHKDQDHAKLREVIAAWVRETGHKVLLCPEMTYQVDIIDPLLYDPLPPDLKKNVVRRNSYWLTDEAASIYRRARAVVSFECHSPIIAAANDTPCIYIRQPEDGIKGQMWKDLGLPDWVFEVEQTTGRQIAARLMDIHRDYDGSQVTVHEAVIYARKLQSQGIDVLRKIVLG